MPISLFNIYSMRHLILFEDLTVVADPVVDNPIFKVRYPELDDLSNKRASNALRKPINDLLDGISIGDQVFGKTELDGDEHSGIVTMIKQDKDGENLTIEIEEDGEILQLLPSSIRRVEEEDPTDPEPYNTNVQPMRETVGAPLKSLVSYSDFKIN